MAEDSGEELEALKRQLRDARKALQDSQEEAAEQSKAAKLQLRDAKRKAKELILTKVAEANRENQELHAQLQTCSQTLTSSQRKVSELEDAVAEADVDKSRLTASEVVLKDLTAKLEARSIHIDSLESQIRTLEEVKQENEKVIQDCAIEKETLEEKVRDLERILEEKDKQLEHGSETAPGLVNGYLDDERSRAANMLPESDAVSGSTVKEVQTKSGEESDSTADKMKTQTALSPQEGITRGDLERLNAAQTVRIQKELAVCQICVAVLSKQRVSQNGTASSTSMQENETVTSSLPKEDSTELPVQKSAKPPHSDPSTEISDSAESEQPDSAVMVIADPIEDTNPEATDRRTELEAIFQEKAQLERRVKALESEIKELKQLSTARNHREGPREAQSEQDEKSTAASEADIRDSSEDLKLKVKKLEQALSSKQVEIEKVKEKARAVFKKLTAEKFDMEKNLKTEMGILKSALETHEEEKATVEQKYVELENELTGCLEVIGEKHRSLQSLYVQLASEKSLREKAAKKERELKQEFDAYKERAKAALDERDIKVSNAQKITEDATRDLTAKLSRSVKEIEALQSELRRAKSHEDDLLAATERANKAEAALDLLRSDKHQPIAANSEELTKLQDQLQGLKSELASTTRATEDAETRCGTTLVRLEVAERALRSADKEREKQRTLSQERVEGLLRKVEELERALSKTRESAMSAQRTAAAAAKAMAHSEVFERRDSIERTDERESVVDGRSTIARTDDGESIIGSGQNEPSGILLAQIAELTTMVKDYEEELSVRQRQVELLKKEVQSLEKKLAAADRLHNDAPFRYLRNIVVRYMETNDTTLIPVLAKLLGLTAEEVAQVGGGSGQSARGNASGASVFSIPFLGGG